MANISYIQIIRKCNQQCLFCSNPDNRQELSYEQILATIEQFRQEGISEVIFTGGEPTLHPDLVKIVKYCNEQGLVCRVITNGQKFSEAEYLRQLIDAGLKKIHLSFYSYQPKVQNYLSQNDFSHQNLLKALVNLSKYNLQLNLNTVINKYNAKHLDKNVLFILKNFPQASHFVFNNCDPYMNRASQNKFVLPCLSDFKTSLNKALQILQLTNKTFRVEKVPLCYMVDFADKSTETRKIVKNEHRLIYFLDQRGYDDQPANKFRYARQPNCDSCSLSGICAGLQGAVDYYDPAELQPQTIDPQIIINKILNDPNP